MAVPVSERHAHIGPVVHHVPGLNSDDRNLEAHRLSAFIDVANRGLPAVLGRRDERGVSARSRPDASTSLVAGP
jgi:hypothetical protein